MEHLVDLRPARPGYRLHQLELVNWGTFDSSCGHVYRCEPRGRTSLLVGHNGSGKSTLVDAILTLLVDSRTRNYNVAAGAKKTERTARSYIRGAYDRTADETHTSVTKYLRPSGTHLTAIAAVFRDEQLDQAFTLCQVLYLTADGTDDKVFALADEHRDLEHDLAGLQKSDAVRDHLKRLGYKTTKTYVEYQGWLAKRTKIRGKAMDMFNQTVAVKDIQSLNAFIRRHMLEAYDWRDKVQRLLTHFTDLSLAHQELVRARRAEELLSPVETHGREYRQLARELLQLESQLAVSPLFFATQILQLFGPHLAQLEVDFGVALTTISRIQDELKAIQTTIRQLLNEIDQAGGDRLKQIPRLIEIEETRLLHKRDAYSRFHGYLSAAGISRVANSSSELDEIRGELRSLAQSTEREARQFTEQYEEAVGQRGGIHSQLRDEQQELELLEQRRTSLPPRFAAIRSQICQDLALDESVLPFAAELIAVLPDERSWEASIEMVLRSFALSLLVPERYYARVRAYVEQNRIVDRHGEGQKLDYICVGRYSEAGGDRLHAQSIARKLQFKPRHDLTPWVRGEVLRRFDVRCCETVDEFHDTDRWAMTRNRHIKFGHERHTKDDRKRTVDPRYFVLGWDNTEKKRRIAERIRELHAQWQQLLQVIDSHQQEIERLRNTRRAALDALETTDFDAIDVNKHTRAIGLLREEQRVLEESNEAVLALRERLRDAECTEQQLSERIGLLHESKALLSQQIEQTQTLLSNAEREIVLAKTQGQYDAQSAWFDSIAASMPAQPETPTDIFSLQQEWASTTRQRTSALRGPLQEIVERVIGAMGRYLREFKEDQDDLDAAIASLDSFLGLLEQLRRDDLPRHEKKFKDRLNDQVSQEVAFFNTELRLERKAIEDKISQLNAALAELEYHPGTYMRLDPTPVQDREIDEFRRSLRECLDESLENSDAAHEARFLRIQKLVERLGNKDATNWRNKVIDVRNWYNFAAREIERESGDTRSFYDGSSGQSGGEKAKLAFTILVAAIAYQYDVDPTGATPGRFQFVVVDEMFSKVDDQNAQFALRLFEQFGLQLLIVAPLDAKARITEPFVDCYLHVVKDSVTSQSQIFSMTAREYEEVMLGTPRNGLTPRANVFSSHQE